MDPYARVRSGPMWEYGRRAATGSVVRAWLSASGHEPATSRPQRRLSLSLGIYALGIQALQAAGRELPASRWSTTPKLVMDPTGAALRPVPLRVEICNAGAGLPGFQGSVSVERWRHWP